MSSLTKLK